jgi:hypothetical protein
MKYCPNSHYRAKSLLFFLGPFLLPKAIGYYRSFAAAPSNRPHAASKPTNRALTLLTISALLFIATTLPLFHPENAFVSAPSGPSQHRMKCYAKSLTPAV